ncbi:MAG TPA: sialidase family protein [Candidatus Caenarcaniphilales bacterium]|nr:sialidase family protein [Candidatus Caenarcaniphilales bacterium]
MRLRRRLLPCAVTLLLAATAGCGQGQGLDPGVQPTVVDPGPIHVHGLGVNPKDGALFIATHTGLFRLATGERDATRVADRYQDTMGFTVVGPDHFLGSGHPDRREGLPPFLGLIESRDGGERWEPLSLLGAVDFHLLEAEGRRVYGYGSDFESRRTLMLMSDDGGRSWQERSPPEPLASLAPRPGEAGHLVASGGRRLHVSRDGARTWTQVGDQAGLLAWPADDRLYLVSEDGSVRLSADGGKTWRAVGGLGEAPTALTASGARELYAALYDGTIKRSTDGGATWELRSRPRASEAG